MQPTLDVYEGKVDGAKRNSGFLHSSDDRHRFLGHDIGRFEPGLNLPHGYPVDYLQESQGLAHTTFVSMPRPLTLRP